MNEALEALRSFIAYRVREGFESAHEIVENATSYALETHGRDDLQSATNASRQSYWPRIGQSRPAGDPRTATAWQGDAGYPIVVQQLVWRRRR